MSYIINGSSKFVSTKLTEKGREMLSKGQLNFASWAIGDSEINYDRVILEDALPSDPSYSKVDKVLRPKDKQPNLRYFLSNGSGNPLITLTSSNIKSLKLTVNNEADTRGFFSATTASTLTTITGDPYTILYTQLPASTFTGGTSFDIATTGVTVGDLVLLKCGDEISTNAIPVPHLWYKSQAVSGTTIYVDRDLPNLTLTGDVQVFIYDGREIPESNFSENSTTAYWDTGTLSFDSSCDITREDVPVWNLNSVFMETLLGTTGSTYEDHTRYGSFEYVGTGNQYLDLGEVNGLLSNTTTIDPCNEIVGVGGVDGFNKSFAVIHYTNNTISNLYGEFFYIDTANNKTLRLEFPTLMYHRRAFAGSGSGDTMGMSFVATGTTKLVGTSDIQYYDLIEEPTLVTGTPLVIGKVYPQLKMVVIEDAEIIAAMSYKSNRSWTLPELITNLAAPSGGTSTGILNNGETMYITYGFENNTGTGYTTSLPCQTFGRITNTLQTPKDVEFRINGAGQLPYMKKIENAGYDNTGFYGYEFKVIYQIVADDARPNPNDWKVLDFTSTLITGNSGETIDPLLLETQNSLYNNQRITLLNDSGATQYDLTNKLNMAPIASPEILQFGDEKFFYGNIDTFIGATIFKTLFDIRIDANQFSITTNPTRSTDITTNPPVLRVSEVGIYDNLGQLVMIGKLSEPIALQGGSTITIELGIDF